MQIVLLFIAGLIILFVVVSALTRFFKKHREAIEETTFFEQEEEDLPSIQNASTEEAEIVEEAEELTQEQKVSEDSTSPQSHFMMISVHAKPNAVFSGYHFLQSMGSIGLEYGEHKIFHYDVKTDIGTQRLFSVAQLNKPGIFDIDHVENINCKGLLMFIDLKACRKRMLALDCMLEAAYQLAEDLDGIMFEGYNTPWQEDTPRALAQQVEEYQKKLASVLDETTY